MDSISANIEWRSGVRLPNEIPSKYHRTSSNFTPVRLLIFGIVLGSMLSSCTPSESPDKNPTNDSLATLRTISLYQFLDSIKSKKVLFGQQAPTQRGYDWFWLKEDSLKNDVYDVSGKNPAVWGYDFQWYPDKPEEIQTHIVKPFEEGAIITFSYHMKNPYTCNSPRDTVKTISHILPGGAAHESFKAILDEIAMANEQFKSPDGQYIPIIFRPWHEHTGNWSIPEVNERIQGSTLCNR